MLDVHPPHHPTNTWRDFFIHIATICVGLLIAVGLEQTVEAIHRSHERAELRESLNAETEQMIKDCLNTEAQTTTYIQYLHSVKTSLSQAEQLHRPIGNIVFPPSVDWDQPSDSVFIAAKADTQVNLLSPHELEAYGELNQMLTRANGMDDLRMAAGRDTFRMYQSLVFGLPDPPPPAFLDSLPKDQVRNFYESIVKDEIAWNEYRLWVRQIRGAAIAIKNGERDLKKIQTAERELGGKQL